MTEAEFNEAKNIGWEYAENCDCRYCTSYRRKPFDMAPTLPTSRMVDEFGFPSPSVEITKEDCELCKRFLGNLRDETLSRGVKKVLEDLLKRLP